MKHLIKATILVLAAATMQGCMSSGSQYGFGKTAFGHSGNYNSGFNANRHDSKLHDSGLNKNSRHVLRDAKKRSASKQSNYADLERTEQELIAQLNKIQRHKGKLKSNQQNNTDRRRFYNSSHSKSHVTTGKASYYGKKFHGRTTASGVPFDMYQMTAAHKTLPFGTKVKVTNAVNGQSVVVTVNDRGPFVGDRILDLSYGAAANINMIQAGIGQIKMQVLN